MKTFIISQDIECIRFDIRTFIINVRALIRNDRVFCKLRQLDITKSNVKNTRI